MGSPSPSRPSTAETPRSRHVRQWLVVLGIALVVRGGVLVARFSELSADPDAYRLIAENVARHGVFGRPRSALTDAPIVPTAYRPPAYPLLLVPLSLDGNLSLVGVAVLHLVLGVATVALTARLGASFGLGSARWLAALLVACDPILLNQSTQVMTETLAAFLTVTVLVAGERWRVGGGLGWALITGVLGGLAALCRPTYLPWLAALAILPLLPPWSTVAGRAGRDSVDRVRSLLVFGLGAALALGPWAIRNKLHFDQFIVTTTHGGYTLLLGNNPEFYRYLKTSRWGEVWEPPDVIGGCRDLLGTELSGDDQPRDELTEDRMLNRCAVTHMRTQPMSAIHAAFYRVGQLWSPLPHRLGAQESTARAALRWLSAVWNAGVLAAAAVGLFRMRQGRRVPYLAGLLLCAVFSLMHLLYWSNLRMRAPLVPFVALVAASCFQAPGSGARWKT